MRDWFYRLREAREGWEAFPVVLLGACAYAPACMCANGGNYPEYPAII